MKHFTIIGCVLFFSGLFGQDIDNTIPVFDATAYGSQTALNNDSDKENLDMKSDTLSVKNITYHGVYGEFLGRNPFWYSIGYEFTKRYLNRHGTGLSTGMGFNPIKKDYLNIHFGVGGFYEFGNQFGFRLGTYLGFNTTPIMYSDKLNDAMAFADMPYIHNVSFIPNISVFYKSKNERWQVLLSVLSYWQNIQIRTTEESNKWLTNRLMTTYFLGATFKYNFKISKNER
jgi:hypothetical protein